MRFDIVSGFSSAVLENRNTLILSQIEANNKEKYSLVAKVVNVGIALLVYARDDGVARRICDVQTQWTGSGQAYMGNKGAVGIRFRVSEGGGRVGETFTCVLRSLCALYVLTSSCLESRFVCAHLTPFEHKLAKRIADYHHIVRTLLFAPESSESTRPTTLYASSHLFFLGDLNFRLAIPPSHPLSVITKEPEFAEALSSEKTREELKEFDQLLVEKRKGSVLVGLREGDFWKFKCSYKCQIGEVDKYRCVFAAPGHRDALLMSSI